MKLSNKCKKKSLNLATFHASVASNFTPYYTDGKKQSSRFEQVVKATKAARKKRARRKASRNYLYDCKGEYSPIIKTEKTREVKARIRFPHPAKLSQVEILEKYTFEYKSEGKEYTKSDALKVVRKKFLRWCKARDFEPGFKFHIVTRDDTFHFIAERCPDMIIRPTRSVASCA